MEDVVSELIDVFVDCFIVVVGGLAVFDLFGLVVLRMENHYDKKDADDIRKSVKLYH